MLKDIMNKMSNLIGNSKSTNIQNATNNSIDGMKLFREVAQKKHNVDFEKVKGNLFEYIEAAKFNVDSASKNSNLKAVVTDSIGRPHDAADIEIIKNDKVVKQVQAKFSTSKDSAVDSVAMHRKEIYKGMDRLIRKDNDFIDKSTGKRTTLLKRTKTLAEKRASVDGGIYQEEYKDVAQHLTDELHHENVTSKGTTLEEIQSAHKNPKKYEKKFIKKPVKHEIRNTAKNMAVANMVTTSVVSGVTNLFQVLKDEKDLSEALGKVGSDVIKSGIQGATTGALSATIRTTAAKTGNTFLSDSMASTVIAGGILDGGIALYSYARGEIDGQQLKEELFDTTIKSTATIYYTKAIMAVAGTSVSPFVPMAVYTAAIYIVTSTREILRNAKLDAEESARLSAIYEESYKLAQKKHKELKEQIKKCEENQRKLLNGFLDNFEYNFETGEDYDSAIESIVKFSNEAGFVLQHADFTDFDNAMKTKQVFKLE